MNFPLSVTTVWPAFVPPLYLTRIDFSLDTKSVVLGNGMVIDPAAFIDELKEIQKENLSLDVRISSAACVVTDMHKYIDREQEKIRGI